MGAFKQLCIETETEQDDNLLLFKDNTIQLFTYLEPKKLVPIKEILMEMKIGLEKRYASNNTAISNTL